MRLLNLQKRISFFWKVEKLNRVLAFGAWPVQKYFFDGKKERKKERKKKRKKEIKKIKRKKEGTKEGKKERKRERKKERKKEKWKKDRLIWTRFLIIFKLKKMAYNNYIYNFERLPFY